MRTLSLVAMVALFGCARGTVHGASSSSGSSSGSASSSSSSSSSSGSSSSSSSSSSGNGSSSGSSSSSSSGSTGSPLYFGVVEEQPAVCYAGEGYPCSAVNADAAERAQLASIAPGLTVRFGGFETENSGFGYPGNAWRRQSNLYLDAGQEDPDWLAARAQLAGYGSWILAVPVTTSKSLPDGGPHVWTAQDASDALDAWHDTLARTGFPPPAFIELGNEPWLHLGGPDGDKGSPATYAAQAGPIGAAVKAKIQAFGWPTRIAAVVDNWPGTNFEQSGYALAYPSDTIALARQVAVNGPPVLQTHGYPNSGYWCPLPETASDHSDLACVYALYVALTKIKAAAPDADLIVTEDNYQSTAYPQMGVHLTLAALLTYAAGGVAYTHYAHNWQGSAGNRYELFDQGAPMPILQNDIPRINNLVKSLHAGEVSFVASGQLHVSSSGYTAIVNAQSAPAPFQSGDAPSHYVFTAGAETVTVDIPTLSVTVSP